MKFRTEIQLPPSQIQIDYNTKILSMGSCFADRMGIRLEDAKIQTLTNPLGIIYNPISLCRIFDFLIQDQFPHLQQSPQGIWHSFDLHTKLSGLKKEGTLAQIQQSLNRSRQHFEDSNLLILTFGTAYVYKRNDNDQIVANCHKYPSSFFEKKLLSVDEIVDTFKGLFGHMQKIKPNLQILLTVSPVRHIKEGLSNNMLSKSMLRLACHKLSEDFEQVNYFPAYEIMLDDLRDYRYYQDDLIHPNNFAEQYIWEKFVSHFFSKKTKELLKKWQKLQKAINHRPLQPEANNYSVFLQKLLNQLKEISTAINCEAEIEEIKARLALIL